MFGQRAKVPLNSRLAIARVVWTLKVASAGGKTAESREPGLDVFRRQPDGSWKHSAGGRDYQELLMKRLSDRGE